MPSEPSAPTIVFPIEYAGKWIVWNKEKTRIVASTVTLEDSVRAAQAAGETEPSFAKAPKADIRFCGVNR